MQYKIFCFVVAYGMVLDRAPREVRGKIPMRWRVSWPKDKVLKLPTPTRTLSEASPSRVQNRSLRPKLLKKYRSFYLRFGPSFVCEIYPSIEILCYPSALTPTRLCQGAY